MDGAEKYSPTHMLQFEAIRESLERGMATYNFGMLISEGQTAGRGVDEFKLGFGAEPRRHLDTIIWKRKPLRLHRTAPPRTHRRKAGGPPKKKVVSRGDTG